MSYSNSELVRAFANGATYGNSNRMSIHGDYLYSYGACIAKRIYTPPCEIKFLVSNRARYLGGEPYSATTSHHISLAYHYCQPNELVKGWVKEG